MPSAVAAARRNLHDMLADAFAGDDDVLVSWSVPLREAEQIVAMSGFFDATAEWAAQGAQRLAETFTLQLVIVVYLAAAQAPGEVEDVAWGLLERIRQTVHGDTTLRAAVMWARVGAYRSEVGAVPAENSGWGLQMDVRVQCSQRITAI